MNSSRLLALVVFFVAGLAPAARAQGLVQVALEGSITVQGGARVEATVTARVGEETRSAVLDLHLAQGSDAHVVAALLAERARLANLSVLSIGAAKGPTTSLFLGDVVSLELRLPAGLVGRIVVCEEAPSLVRLLPPPPSSAKGAARLVLAATTLHPVTGLGGRTVVDFALPADGSAVKASEQLFAHTVAAGWVADRPTNDAWRPVRVGDSSLVRGLSVEIVSEGPEWGLAVELDAPRQ